MRTEEREKIDSPKTQEPSAYRSRKLIGNLAFRLRAFVFLALIIVVFSVVNPRFLEPQNLIVMSKHSAQIAILAIGMLLVIIPGGIDLSVGSVAGLTGIIAGGLINEGLVLPIFGVVVYYQVWAVILIGLLVGVVVGAVNGFVVTRLRVAPFIATLGMLFIARGVALLRSGGATFPNLRGDPELGTTGFGWLGSGEILGLPVPIWIMFAFAIAASFLLGRTSLGRHIYAVGGNERAAELAGVKIGRVKLVTYVASAACAAMVGMIIASEIRAAHPATGQLFELNAIAAVVLGGASLMGGRGTVQGAIVGAFVIGFLGDGLVQQGVSSFWQMVVKGVVVIIAVAFDQAQERWQQNRLVQAASSEPKEQGR